MSLWRNRKHKIWLDDGLWYEMDLDSTPNEPENIKVIPVVELDDLDEDAPEE